MESITTGIKTLKDFRLTIKRLMLVACENVLKETGFTVNDTEFKINNKETFDLDIILNKMKFEEQRSKLKVCKRICRFITCIDFFLQTNLHQFVQKQIKRFEADVYKHYKYIPSDDLLTGTDVETVLEGERSLDDPKVSNRRELTLV